MKLFEINTTADHEENFYILTDLTEQDLTEIIHPSVMAERDGEDTYNNESLFIALKKRYPNNLVKKLEPELLIY